MQQLLESGRLRIPEYANPSLILMLYGAAWCLAFGFSFIALGISTWTLWIALQLSVYFLVLEIGGARRNALIGAAVVGFFPTCFTLAPTFMSDVPFLAAQTASMLFFARGRATRSLPFAQLVSRVSVKSGVARPVSPTGRSKRSGPRNSRVKGASPVGDTTPLYRRCPPAPA